MAAATRDDAVGRILAQHRGFVHALGGYSLDFGGGLLVTHERIGVPAFNYVEEVGVAVARQAAFFERALDHYFQRALRPAIRLRAPAEPHLAATLQRIGFRSRTQPRRLLAAPLGGVSDDEPGATAIAGLPVDAAERAAAFWTHDRERDEFHRSLDVAFHHPNPGESLEPVFLIEDEATASAGLLYRRGSEASLHAIATAPSARGQGRATELVVQAQRIAARRGATQLTLASDWGPLGTRLARLGFTEVGQQVEFELPADAELSLPSSGPPQPPRWRPPRRASGA
jgi:GNAT superfamily N-acetyltransferase